MSVLEKFLPELSPVQLSPYVYVQVVIHDLHYSARLYESIMSKGTIAQSCCHQTLSDMPAITPSSFLSNT